MDWLLNPVYAIIRDDNSRSEAGESNERKQDPNRHHFTLQNDIFLSSGSHGQCGETRDVEWGELCIRLISMNARGSDEEAYPPITSQGLVPHPGSLQFSCSLKPRCLTQSGVPESLTKARTVDCIPGYDLRKSTSLLDLFLSVVGRPGRQRCYAFLLRAGRRPGRAP